VSVSKDIVDLIPMFVAGRLSDAESKIVREQIQQLPELQSELALWQGIHSIRRQLPRFDSSGHPPPELLDLFAQGKINQLSGEYGEITRHLQNCPACSEDVECLRQVVKLIPEEHVKMAEERSDWMRSIFGIQLPTVRALAPVFSFLVVVLAMYVIFQRTGDQGGVATILLNKENASRTVTDSSQVPEMQVFLKQDTRKVVFAFSTDRVEVPEYRYVVVLIPQAGTPIELSSVAVECQPTQVSNQCELPVTDARILSQLKLGGSFVLSIIEQFPGNVELEPMPYTYYFRVSVK